MPISADSPFIIATGKRLGVSLSKGEISFLCTACSPDDELLNATRGYFKRLSIHYANATSAASYKVRLTTKYVVLTQDRIIAFDADTGDFYNTKEIDFISIYSQKSRGSSQIFCNSQIPGEYLLMGMDDAAAVKFANAMNIYRDENDDDDEFSRIQMGVGHLRLFYNELRESGEFSNEELDEMFDAPPQWGSAKPKETLN